MSRRAFTLMELLISVVLIALIAMYLYASLGRTRASNSTLRTHTEAQEQRLKTYELLYRDFMESYRVETMDSKSKRYQILKMRTGNSLYDIAAPYVIYFVRTDTRQLIRLESAEPITLPVRDDDQRNRLHADLIEEKVTDMNYYVQKAQTKNQTAGTDGGSDSKETNTTAAGSFTNHLFYLATEQGEPLLMEIAF